jgi:prepilin-type N-terminal cleavage/methylation domain-containing protein
MRPVEPDFTPLGSRSIGWRGVARRGVGRGGFTIVEIMTVIGILLILVSIAAIAYKSLNNPTGGASTKITLNNLQAQLSEYEAQAGLRNQPPNFWKNGTLLINKPPSPSPFDIWKDEAVLPPLPDSDPRQNGNVSMGATARYAWDAIGNTQRAYQIFARVPANKQAVAKLPTQQVLGACDSDDPAIQSIAKTKLFGAGPLRIDPPLILDAWNNPIIFVGSRGLKGVYVGRKPNKDGTKSEDYDPPHSMTVTSVGTFDTKAVTATTAAGARPFFASAGPDGNFRTGDDNVYSFNP